MAYLPGTEVNHDQEGGSSRVRPGHCTKAWLTSTITPNVGNSSAKFLLYGGLRPRLPPLTSLAETFLPQVRCRLYFHIRFLIRISTNAHSNFIFKSLIYVYILYSCVHTPPPPPNGKVMEKSIIFVKKLDGLFFFFIVWNRGK